MEIVIDEEYIRNIIWMAIATFAYFQGRKSGEKHGE